MIPEALRQHCLTLQNQVGDLRSQLGAETASGAGFKLALEPINQTFQTQLQLFDGFAGDANLAQQIQTIHTELNKQIRLLSVELTFLQSARQPATRQQRLAQVHDRLDQIQSYCTVLLTIAV